jgi:hypothetical protein
MQPCMNHQKDAKDHARCEAKPVALPLREFKHIVHAIDRHATAFLQADVTPNFHSAQIRHEGKPLYLVASACNSFGQHHWALCGVLEHARCHLEFAGNDEIAKRLRTQCGIRLLTPAELNHHVVSHPEVGDADMRYWRPKTLGDALFNWWD